MKSVKGIMVFLLGSSLMLQGCGFLIGAGLGTGAGAATVAYVQGELQTIYAAPFDRTWAASLSALKDLKISVYNTQKDPNEGSIEATEAGGTKVKLNLKITGPDTTSVKIRVGTFGDEELSKTISKKISDILGRKG